jgi:hypothetical protein
MDLPPSPPSPRRRSVLLTLACAAAFLAALQAFAFSFGPDYRNFGATLGARWLPGFVLGSSLLSIAFLVALWWRMRRWALWGFLAVAAAQSVAWVHLGWWRPTMLVLPALVGGAAAWTWDRLH